MTVRTIRIVRSVKLSSQVLLQYVFVVIVSLILKEPSQQTCLQYLFYSSDMFHQECLNLYGQQMPPTTAPAGYICPKCTIPIFSFNSDKNSPVASLLTQLLSNYAWANEGLSDMNKKHSSSTKPEQNNQNKSSNNSKPSNAISNGPSKVVHENEAPKILHSLANKQNFPSSTPISMNSMTSFISSHSDLSFGSTSSMRNKFETERRSLLSSDTLEDKYRHRSMVDFISRWFRYRTTNFRNNSNLAFGAYTRIVVLIIFILFCFISLIYIFAVFGRISADNDPMLNPDNNPNLHETLD